jgi:hypothetical protein
MKRKPNSRKPSVKHSPSSGSGVIELRLRTVGQLFNSMDPTPFPEKDLDADVEDFIVGWALEHPRRVPLVLLVHLAEPPEDRDPKPMIQDAMHSYFKHKTELTRRQLRHLIGRGRLSLLIGMLFLAACLGMADFIGRLGGGPLIQILRESMVIGGWVAMWRPMEIFLYDWWPLLNERRVYERLSRVDVRVLLREE